MSQTGDHAHPGRIRVASLQDFPTSGRLCVRVGSTSVALFRVGHEVFATQDACPHEGVSLSRGGILKGEEITCGYHFWCFNVRTGESVDGLGDPLTRFQVHVQDGLVYLVTG